MGDVDEQRGIELAAQLLKRGEIGRIRIHREQAFRDHENPAFGVAAPNTLQMASRGL